MSSYPARLAAPENGLRGVVFEMRGVSPTTIDVD
jgi:hypothetical protein